MKKTDLPARKPVPFGANGSRRDLTAKTPTGSNQASYDAGFPPITMTIKAAGGLPPDGRDMNQALNELYTGYRWHNAGAGYPFDADFATAIGGYPAGAKVPNSTNDGFWLNTIDGNTTNPEVLDASATGWVPVNSYGITSITGLETGTITLTTLQAAKEELVFSGNLIADTTVIFPPWIRNWTVTNHCQGNFTLTCKPLSGTGVVLPSGRNVIRCDGSQIIFAIPVASLTQHGLTRLSSATDSNDETLAVTPKAVKAAYDLAKTVTEEVNKKLDKASVLQTTGNATDKVISQKVITDELKSYLKINNNLSEIKNKAEARNNLGLGAAALLKAATASANESGHIFIPAIINGEEQNFMFQWMTLALDKAESGKMISKTFKWTTPFPNACLTVMTSLNKTSYSTNYSPVTASKIINKSQVEVASGYSASPSTVVVFGIGY